MRLGRFFRTGPSRGPRGRGLANRKAIEADTDGTRRAHTERMPLLHRSNARKRRWPQLVPSYNLRNGGRGQAGSAPPLPREERAVRWDYVRRRSDRYQTARIYAGLPLCAWHIEQEVAICDRWQPFGRLGL